MSMYQLEDFVEFAVRTVALSDLSKQEKRDLIHTLFEMEGYGDCSFTNLRTIHEMINCSYSFAFEAKEMYNYNENPDMYDPERNCYDPGDVYYDSETKKFCVDSGSKTWEEMVGIGAITGEGATPVVLLPHIEVLKRLKLLMGDMDEYTRQGYWALTVLTGAFDEMTDEDCLIIFGTDKEEAENMLEDDDRPLVADSQPGNTKTSSILGHACQFTTEVTTSENGDILLKGINSETCMLNIFNRKIPFTVTLTPSFNYPLLSNEAKQMFETNGSADDDAMDYAISQFSQTFPLDAFIAEINHALSFSDNPDYIDTFVSQYMLARNISKETQVEINRMWCEYTFSNSGTQCDIYIQVKAENDMFSFDLRLRSGCEITGEKYGTNN